MSEKEQKNYLGDGGNIKVLPVNLKEKIIESTERIKERLIEMGWRPWLKPEIEPKGAVFGEGMAEGSSIVGIEKYLGMVDPKERIAYFPSVKLTNDSTVAKTYVKFNPDFKEDIIFIGGKEAEGREKERVINVLERFRQVTGITSKALVVSENFFRRGVYGKGLGTSAAAGGALATALISAGVPELIKNTGFVESIARIMAGSAPQSVAGGFSVWLSDSSFVSRPHESYSVRIDDGKIPLKLVIVPIEQSAKTEEAHEAAVKSPYYLDWCRKKITAVPDLIEAVIEKDLKRIGEHAEDDSIWLNKIITTGGGVNNWETDTEKLRQKIIELRKNGLTAYYSMDTGPSVAVLTTPKNFKAVKKELENALGGKYKGKVFLADLTGGPRILPLEEKKNLIRQIEEELENFGIEI